VISPLFGIEGANMKNIVDDNMEGFVHSIETFGTVDGPGVRYVVFMQGCPMRCLYCHNPDTWELNKGMKKTTNDILKDYEKYRPYLTGGGLTVTGGEPLLQIDFIIELFKKAKALDIHTCIDTSGVTFNRTEAYLSKLDELLEYTDLIMLDIKHIDDEKHKELTGYSNVNILDFAKYLSEKEFPVWIRHVTVPGFTYVQEYLVRLGEFLAELKNIKALDILPYHTMGVPKYEAMNMEYPLKDVEALDRDDAVKARNLVLYTMKRKRKENE
jgi:pyruvate formate lyase activating enzyme